MANKRIADFTALTTLAATDEIVIVDKSDTTDSGDGTTKKYAVGITSGFVSLDDIQTLTNKTLTTPTITNPAVTTGTFSSPTITTPSVTGGTFSSPTITSPTVTSGTFSSPTLTAPTVTGASGDLFITAATDGGDFNIYHNESGTKTLAFYGSGGNTLNIDFLDGSVRIGNQLDMDGNTLILDADADTYIIASTDDQAEVYIAGAADFRFSANALTALSGSSFLTNTISETTAGSGVTIDSLLVKDGAIVWDGWIPVYDTWTYASATSFTISGVDRTSIFIPGTKITLAQSTGGTKYWYVLSSSFSSDTTVNIIQTGDYTLVNEAITSPKYSLIERPIGFPRSFDYSTIVTIATNTSMTYTSVSITMAEYSISGGVFSYELNVLGTTGGTLSNSIYASVPITPNPNTNALLGGGAAVFDSANEAGFSTYSTSSGNNLLFRRTAAGNFTAGSGRGFKATVSYII